MALALEERRKRVMRAPHSLTPEVAGLLLDEQLLQLAVSMLKPEYLRSWGGREVIEALVPELAERLRRRIDEVKKLSLPSAPSPVVETELVYLSRWRVFQKLLRDTPHLRFDVVGRRRERRGWQVWDGVDRRGVRKFDSWLAACWYWLQSLWRRLPLFNRRKS